MKTSRFPIFFIFLGMVITLIAGCTIHARTYTSDDPYYSDPNSSYSADPDYNSGYVSQEPPAPQYEQPTPCPGHGYTWIGGYWHWSGQSWVWIQGRWERTPGHNKHWAPGHWKKGKHSKWYWVDGRWQ